MTSRALTDSPAVAQSNPLGKKEPYYAAGQFAMIDANKARKKCLQPDGFKYANPMKKSCSVGDNFGTFSKLTYKEPFNPVKKGDPPRPVAEVPPNIKCNPIKKGSYGANWGCMLGPEYRYQSRPAAKEVEERRKIREEHEAKIGGRNPFRGVCHPTAPSEKTMLEVYKAVPLPPEKPKPEKVVLDQKPFYPSKVPKTGLAYCAMNPFPEYKSGGNFDEVQKAQRAAAAAERAKIQVPFKAVSNPKKLYQVPVMTHPSNIHQNANLNLPSGTVHTTVAGEGK